MEVFEFNKSLLERLSESEEVLQCRDQFVPASQVRTEWACHIELQIEPTGWEALWKISRVICEELKIKYPTVVYGMVENVLFKELKAVFRVIAVQDDDIVNIPNEVIVHLDELWPLMKQENNALNIEQTAECLDNLRFFYNNIWMPWDNDYDDDLDWAEKHLESRIRFFYDLKTNIKPSLACHIRILLQEARYVFKRREYMELNLSDSEDLDDTETGDHHHNVTNLMRLNLRLMTIRQEIEMLENPELRYIFAEIKFPKATNGNISSYDRNWARLSRTNNNNVDDDNDNVSTIDDPYLFIVSSPSDNLLDQINYLQKIRDIKGDQKKIKIFSTLQECLDKCNRYDQIFIPNGCHSIKFLEYLNYGSLEGFPLSHTESMDVRLKRDLNTDLDTILVTHNEDSILLIIDGDFIIKNVTFDCRNVRTGAYLRKGTVTLENCTFIGDVKSTTKIGIVVRGDTKLTLRNCLIKNFATAINCCKDSTVQMIDSVISDCFCGIEMIGKCHLETNKCKIENCQSYGILIEYSTENITVDDDRKHADAEEGIVQKYIYNSFNDIKWPKNVKLPPTLDGDCQLNSNKWGNILINNKKCNRIFRNLSESVDDEAIDHQMKDECLDTKDVVME